MTATKYNSRNPFCGLVHFQVNNSAARLYFSHLFFSFLFFFLFLSNHLFSLSSICQLLVQSVVLHYPKVRSSKNFSTPKHSNSLMQIILIGKDSENTITYDGH